MSNNKKIRIQRLIYKWQGRKRVELVLGLIDEHGKYRLREYFEYLSHKESNITKYTLSDFVDRELRQMTPQIIEAVRKMSTNNTREQMVEIPVELQLHSLCKTNKNVESYDQATTEISQFELRNKLATISKGSKLLKLYEENKCSVCLSNYKEILDEDLHIVIPACGHPLCCKCADNILHSEKNECPQCRGRITAD